MTRRQIGSRFFCILVSALFCNPLANAQTDSPLADRADAALRRAVAFFTTRVATEGGYLWRYSEDLQRREGEGRADDRTVWVQPPGTPTVGLALLEAYRATGDQYLLDAASAAGMCLVRGQLESGGWEYRIDFDPDRRKRYAYRVDGRDSVERLRNTSTLDDNTTQAALRLLMELDRQTQFKNEPIHEAALYALDSLLAAQYPNGAWPQRYQGPIGDRSKFPVQRAGYPDSWSREFPGTSYLTFYTLNDNALADVIDVMFHAYRVYGDDRYRNAAKRGGEFLLLAQMPEPQPAWAQQYDAAMHPAWARKFEPPAVTGGESQGALRILLHVFYETGERKYLEPIPRALSYLEASRLEDGRLARFYELKTNRPLYFTKDYALTYSDRDMPTHYAFKVGCGIDSIRRQYQRAVVMTPAELALRREENAVPPKPRLTSHLEAEARGVIESLDERGRFVQPGRLKSHGEDDPTTRVITTEAFARNIRLLSRYLAAVCARGESE